MLLYVAQEAFIFGTVSQKRVSYFNERFWGAFLMGLDKNITLNHKNFHALIICLVRFFNYFYCWKERIKKIYTYKMKKPKPSKSCSRKHLGFRTEHINLPSRSVYVSHTRTLTRAPLNKKGVNTGSGCSLKLGWRYVSMHLFSPFIYILLCPLFLLFLI